jgi:hypothetical protein
MNPEYELELLRAFADSKSYEFKGFKLRYAVAHPEPEEVVVVEPVEAKPEVVEEPVAEEKPKSKKKALTAAVDEDAGA